MKMNVFQKREAVVTQLFIGRNKGRSFDVHVIFEVILYPRYLYKLLLLQ